MDLVSLTRKRYTAKAYDPNKAIPQDIIDQLLEALRLSASSVNSQPWHFFVASSTEGRARVGKGTEGANEYNHAKVLNASHVVVLSALTDITDAHLQALTEQEKRDGRGDGMDQGRRFYVGLHREQQDVAIWAQKQVYLALGSLLLGAVALGLDATPIEGFDSQALDAELGLAERGLTSLVLVALGYHSDEDFNFGVPKSRLPAEKVFTYL